MLNSQELSDKESDQELLERKLSKDAREVLSQIRDLVKVYQGKKTKLDVLKKSALEFFTFRFGAAGLAVAEHNVLPKLSSDDGSIYLTKDIQGILASADITAEDSARIFDALDGDTKQETKRIIGEKKAKILYNLIEKFILCDNTNKNCNSQNDEESETTEQSLELDDNFYQYQAFVDYIDVKKNTDKIEFLLTDIDQFKKNISLGYGYKNCDEQKQLISKSKSCGYLESDRLQRKLSEAKYNQIGGQDLESLSLKEKKVDNLREVINLLEELKTIEDPHLQRIIKIPVFLTRKGLFLRSILRVVIEDRNSKSEEIVSVYLSPKEEDPLSNGTGAQSDAKIQHNGEVGTTVNVDSSPEEEDPLSNGTGAQSDAKIQHNRERKSHLELTKKTLFLPFFRNLDVEVQKSFAQEYSKINTSLNFAKWVGRKVNFLSTVYVSYILATFLARVYAQFVGDYEREKYLKSNCTVDDMRSMGLPENGEWAEYFWDFGGIINGLPVLIPTMIAFSQFCGLTGKILFGTAQNKYKAEYIQNKKRNLGVQSNPNKESSSVKVSLLTSELGFNGIRLIVNMLMQFIDIASNETKDLVMKHVFRFLGPAGVMEAYFKMSVLTKNHLVSINQIENKNKFDTRKEKLRSMALAGVVLAGEYVNNFGPKYNYGARMACEFMLKTFRFFPLMYFMYHFPKRVKAELRNVQSPAYNRSLRTSCANEMARTGLGAFILLLFNTTTKLRFVSLFTMLDVMMTISADSESSKAISDSHEQALLEMKMQLFTSIMKQKLINEINLETLDRSDFESYIEMFVKKLEEGPELYLSVEPPKSDLADVKAQPHKDTERESKVLQVR